MYKLWKSSEALEGRAISFCAAHNLCTPRGYYHEEKMERHGRTPGKHGPGIKGCPVSILQHQPKQCLGHSSSCRRLSARLAFETGEQWGERSCSVSVTPPFREWIFLAHNPSKVATQTRAGWGCRRMRYVLPAR